MAEHDQHVPGTCRSDQHCKAHDGRNAQPTSQPLCRACLDAACLDIRALVYDYLDLAQLHETSMSQAASEKTSGGEHESPTLLADHVEALQAEIVHVLSVWEHALRADGRLSNPRTFAPLWRNTVYDRINLFTRGTGLRKARSGAIVQRAVSIIGPRLERLAALTPITVCPSGIEDDPVVMSGWEAVHQLQSLHARARGFLGRTTRKFWIPGDCWAQTCGARPKPGEDGPLYRSEPRRFEDPMEVHCARCGGTRSYADYEHVLVKLQWPDQASDADVRVAA